MKHSDEGFSLIEVIISGGLLIVALGASFMIVLGTEHALGRFTQREDLAVLVENIATDLRAGTAYQGATLHALAAQQLHNDALIENPNLGKVRCSTLKLVSVQTVFIISCQTDQGVLVQRLFRLGSGVPQPGSLVGSQAAL